ncbi:hypothetical protein AV944_08185 [Sphingomonas sp. LK11]|nr:hypothetical protein AV944_08185 [Sphingomonas sp. LK11]
MVVRAATSAPVKTRTLTTIIMMPASCRPSDTIRHINQTVTIDFFVEFRRRNADIRLSRAKFATLRRRYAMAGISTLL